MSAASEDPVTATTSTGRLRMTIDIPREQQEEFHAFWRDWVSRGAWAEKQRVMHTERAQGVASLQYLVHWIRGPGYSCGGAYRIAEVLGSLYNGTRIQADLFDLGGLDAHLVEHLLQVIRLHCSSGPEIHTYFDNREGLPSGNEVFEGFIADYGLERRRRAPLDDYDVERFCRLARAVRDNRFVLRDAWYAITGNPKQVFPRKDDAAGIRQLIAVYQREGLLTYSEGEKGGEGWRLTTLGCAVVPPAAVAQPSGGSRG